MQLALVEHTVFLEEFDRFRLDQLPNGVQRGLEVRQASLGRLDLPLLGVAIAVVHHIAMFGDDLGEQCLQGLVEVLAVADSLLQLGGHVVQRVRHDRVDDDQRHGNRLPRARRAELEPVAGERERARAVAVTRIGRQRRQGVDTDDHRAFALGRRGRALRDLLEHVGELFTEEDRDDRRRCLISAQAVVVGGRGDRNPQQPGELVHGADHRRAEHQELRVLVRGVARNQQRAQL